MGDERRCRECNQGNCAGCLVAKCQCPHPVTLAAKAARLREDLISHAHECDEDCCGESCPDFDYLMARVHVLLEKISECEQVQ